MKTKLAVNTTLYAIWPILVYTATDKGLSGSWKEFWAPIGGGPIGTAMGWIGAAAMVMSLIGFFWSKRKGQGNPQLTQGLLWVAIFGGILALPGTLLPVLLGLVDSLIKALAKLVGNIK